MVAMTPNDITNAVSYKSFAYLIKFALFIGFPYVIFKLVLWLLNITCIRRRQVLPWQVQTTYLLCVAVELSRPLTETCLQPFKKAIAGNHTP